MIPTTLRSTLAALAFALSGAALGQQAPAPAPPSTAPAPSSGSIPSAQPAPRSTPAATGATQERSRRSAAKDASGAPEAGAGGAAPATGAAQPSTGTTPRSAKGGGRQKGDQPVGRALQNAYVDLMTAEELAAHKTKVKSVKTYAECRALFDATGKAMEARAKAQNKTVKSSPAELCDRAKERGRVTG